MSTEILMKTRSWVWTFFSHLLWQKIQGNESILLIDKFLFLSRISSFFSLLDIKILSYTTSLLSSHDSYFNTKICFLLAGTKFNFHTLSYVFFDTFLHRLRWKQWKSLAFEKITKSYNVLSQKKVRLTK